MRLWRFGSLLANQYITCVPAQMNTGDSWYMGTADAIYQNINLIRQENPFLTAVFGGDHIYKMDVSAMAKYHHVESPQTVLLQLYQYLWRRHGIWSFRWIQIGESLDFRKSLLTLFLFLMILLEHLLVWGTIF